MSPLAKDKKLLQSVDAKVLDNGLTVVVESMPEVQSASFALLIPAGSACDPPGQGGIGSVLCDWMSRGAGTRDNRTYSAELDRLGLQHGQTVASEHLIITGSCLAENLPAALEITADMVLCPQLTDEEFPAAVASVIHELDALEDDPRQKVMHELVRRCYAAPWGQPPEGSLAELEELTPEAVRAHYRQFIRPGGAILGIAGRVTPTAATRWAEAAFGEWQPGSAPTPLTGSRGPQVAHVPADSAQTHIGVAFPAVPYGHPDYYAAWAAVTVLSGGTSSRLFTEVREKRGLCYAVYAMLGTLRHEAAVLCYAGTSPDRAQQTLEVLLKELWRLTEGIRPEELSRSQALAKSALVMQQESTAAQAGSIARDWYHLGRVTSLDEVQQRIEALTPQDVLSYLRQHPPVDLTVVTIGPAPLEVPPDPSRLP